MLLRVLGEIVLTVFWHSEECGHQRILWSSQQLHYVIIQRIFIFIQPSIDIVSNL